MLNTTKITIETPRLVLRAFTMDDLEDMYEYASVLGVGEAAGWPHHKSRDTTVQIIEGFLQKKDVFAIWHRADAKVIGSLGLHDKGAPGAREMGYVLAKPYWGQGLATEAAAAAIDFCWNVLQLDAINICHFAENDRSRRVIEKLGFIYEKDDIYYAAALDTHFPEKKYVLKRAVI
jgi:ribosomal-protein-alanine N-acetyltransferase